MSLRRMAVNVAFATVAAAPAAAQTIPDDFLLTLERTACFGDCPVYTVTIDARGNVAYEGKASVRVTGKATDRVPVARVRDLLDTIERIGFFKLSEQYREIRNPDGTLTIVTDLPTTFVTVTMAGRTKRVEDYVGAPPDLRELEREVDAVANTRRWLRIDGPTLRRLAGNGQLSPRQREKFLLEALLYDDVDVLTALLDLGVEANAPYGEGNFLPIVMVQSAAAARALIAAGASVVARDERGESALGRAASRPPELTEVLLKAGAPADLQVDLDGSTALIWAASLGNIGVVRLLLAAGANPFHRARDSSALEAARKGRESERQRRFPRLEPGRFVQDFDGVIAALEEALARKRSR
ncbi:MAG TPA: ankyrin repeat domain-containing protein [Vicinamibacterales bacterium]|nr:ankyrin repeat domain-containing protein [Vicinamibacterales bacterium]